jgi:tetratricopeptide (TPR) repeat protein
MLPTQRRAEEAETLLSGLLAQKGEKTPPEVLAALAWLAHRAGKPDAQRWIAQCRERLAEVRGGQAQAVAGLLAALAGDWHSARDAYLAAGNTPGAALADLQASDQALAQGETEQAQADCERAYHAGLAAGEPLIAAMARYRQAEIDWRSGRAEAAREMLAQAEALLEQAPASLAAEGISAIRRAYKIINLNRSTSWQFWLSQNTSDRFTIKVLFPAE